MESNKEATTKDLSGMSRMELEKRYLVLETEYKSAMARVKWYEEQYRLSRKRKYGRSSEKDAVPGQMTIEDMGVPVFNEAEKDREERRGADGHDAHSVPGAREEEVRGDAEAPSSEGPERHGGI